MIVEHTFISSNRYAFDFSDEAKNGWKQYDTSQDAWYYGVWYNPEKMQVLDYTEGDVYLCSTLSWGEWIEKMKAMDKFHGAAPPMAVAGSRLGMDGKLVDPVPIFDERARWDYNNSEPEHKDAIPLWKIQQIFIGGS